MSKRSSDDNGSKDHTKQSKLDNSDSQNLAVILKQDGSLEQVNLSSDYVETILEKHNENLIGVWDHWDDYNVVIISKSDQNDRNKQVNKHVLQPPFHKKEIYGDIILIKMDNNSVSLDYSVEEYNKFQAEEIEEWELDADEEEDEDHENTDKNNEEDEDNDDEDDKFIEVISLNIQNNLKKLFNRLISNEENELINESINFVSVELQSYDPEDENADIDKVSKDIKVKIFDHFSRKLQRHITETEEKIIEIVLSNILSYYNENFDDNDEADGDDGIDDNKTKEFLEFLTKELKEKFIKENNREPNDNEMISIQNNAAAIASGDIDDENDEEIDDEGDEDEEAHDVHDDDDDDDDDSNNDDEND